MGRGPGRFTPSYTGSVAEVRGPDQEDGEYGCDAGCRRAFAAPFALAPLRRKRPRRRGSWRMPPRQYPATWATAYADTPAVIVPMRAPLDWAAFLYDQPNAGRGVAYANAMRSSGAGARSCCRIRIHRAGSTAEAVAVAQEAMGSTGNPVIDVAVSLADGTLTVTFADGTTRTENAAGGHGRRRRPNGAGRGGDGSKHGRRRHGGGGRQHGGPVGPGDSHRKRH